MGDLLRMSDFLARRLGTQPAPPCEQPGAEAAGAVHRCPRCKHEARSASLCDGCANELELDRLERLRFQEHRAARRGLCPGCYKPLSAKTLLGIEHGYVAYHPDCYARREP